MDCFACARNDKTFNGKTKPIMVTKKPVTGNDETYNGDVANSLLQTRRHYGFVIASASEAIHNQHKKLKL